MLSTLENSKIGRDTVKVLWDIRMEECMKVNGSMIWDMDMGMSDMKMEISTWGLSKQGKLMGTVTIHGQN